MIAANHGNVAWDTDAHLDEMPHGGDGVIGTGHDQAGGRRGLAEERVQRTAEFLRGPSVANHLLGRIGMKGPAESLEEPALAGEESGEGFFGE